MILGGEALHKIGLKSADDNHDIPRSSLNTHPLFPHREPIWGKLSAGKAGARSNHYVPSKGLILLQYCDRPISRVDFVTLALQLDRSERLHFGSVSLENVIVQIEGARDGTY